MAQHSMYGIHSLNQRQSGIGYDLEGILSMLVHHKQNNFIYIVLLVIELLFINTSLK